MAHTLVVNGAAGRMGRLVVAELERAGLGPVAGCDPASSDAATSIRDLESVEPRAVIVDFSHPSSTPALVRAARQKRASLVVGTTGQSSEELAALREVATLVPVVLARNFALGLNRLLEFIPMLRVLIEDGFDVECMEAHHRGKRDAPSGTALAWLEALLGADPQGRVHGRHGSEVARRPGEVGIHSLRLGGVVGEHALVFGSDHEVIEIRHRALDRTAFVSGIVPAVRFVRTSPPGLYSIRDVMRHAATVALE